MLKQEPTSRGVGILGLQAGEEVNDLIFLPLEREHCRKAYEAERLGRQLPTEYRR